MTGPELCNAVIICTLLLVICGQGSCRSIGALQAKINGQELAQGNSSSSSSASTAYVAQQPAESGKGTGIQPGHQTVSLVEALTNPNVTSIILLTNYSIGHEFDKYMGEGAALPVKRNVTLSAEPGSMPVLDVEFVRSAVHLCSSCTFTMKDVAIANERRGNGAGIDFFVGEPGSVAVLLNAYRLRPACTTTDSTVELIKRDQKRSARFPSRSPNGTDVQWLGRKTVTFQGRTYEDMVWLIDFSYDVPLTWQEGRGLVGGFNMMSVNTTRLCSRAISAACLKVKSPDACVNDAIDDALAAAGKESHTHSSANGTVIAVAVSVAVVGGLLLPLLVLWLLWRRRRLRRSQHASLSDMGQSSKTGFAGSVSANNTPSGPEADDGSVDPFIDGSLGQPRLDQGWEVVSMNTTPSVGMVGNCKIHFGVLLGAGSFGRVYKGRWAGREVAVKCIEHDSETAKAVENEVQLMLALDHPNIVKAYHYITYQHAVRCAGTPSSNAGPSKQQQQQQQQQQQRGPSTTAPRTPRSRQKCGQQQLQMLEEQLKQQQQLDPQQQQDTSFGALTHTLQHGRCVGGPSTQDSSSSGEACRIDLPASSSSNGDCSGPIPQPVVSSEEPPSSLLPHQPADADSSSSSGAKGFNASTNSTAQQGVVLQQQLLQPPLQQEQPQQADEQEQQQVKGMSGALGSRGSGRSTGSNSESLHPPPHGSALGSRPGSRRSEAAQTLTPTQKAQLRLFMQRQQHLLLQHSSTGRSKGILPALPGGSPAAAADSDASCAAGSPTGVDDTGRTPRTAQEQQRSRTYIVQEYCDLGTLGSYASKMITDPSDDHQLLQLLLLLEDAARGLEALHSKSIVHGDLNARNVLVSTDSSHTNGAVAKLADLGLARVVRQHSTHKTTKTVGTLSHMPPELLRYGRMSSAVDVYSFGIMMWETFTGQPAFRHLHYGQFFECIVLKNMRPNVPEDMPRDYSLLMLSCWVTNPADRPSAERLLDCLGLMIQDRQEGASQEEGEQGGWGHAAALHGHPAGAAAAADVGVGAMSAAVAYRPQGFYNSGGDSSSSSASLHLS